MKGEDKARLIGYARVSTNGQELQLQLDALLKAGVANKAIFKDKASGAKSSRPGLDGCLRQLKPGDTLLVWRLDRLGRSLRHLIDVVEDLRQRGLWRSAKLSHLCSDKLIHPLRAGSGGSSFQVVAFSK